MASLVSVAKKEVGELKGNEKFCLKLAIVIGGEYEKSNLGKITFPELITFSGDLGFQIKDMKDGQKIKVEE